MTEERKCPCEAMIKVQDQLTQHDKRLTTGDGNFKLIEYRLGVISNDTTEIKQDVKCINQKPAKKWDSFVDNIVKLVTVIILGYIATHLGLS